MRKVLATLQKWGNSNAIRIPKHVLAAVNWHENDKVEIEVADGKLSLSKVEIKKSQSLSDVFAGYDGHYTCQEMDWGKAEGNEVW